MTTWHAVRFVVADGQPLYREAVGAQLRRLYPDAHVDEVGTYDDLVERAGMTAYSLFMVDFHTAGVTEHAIAQLAVSFPVTPIVVMSGSGSAADMRASVRAGAKGFISKTATADELAAAIQSVLAGGTSIPADISPRVQTAAPLPEWLARLSPRERQVLAALARGISNKQIAQELHLAEITVKLHLRAIFRKTGARTRSEAAVLATKTGIA